MNPLRKQRLWVVIWIVVGVSGALGLGLYALRQNINLFYTPSQVWAGSAPREHVFRVGGLVRKGSVQHTKGTLQVSFVLSDTAHDLRVYYNGVLPDLFREGQGVVAEGQLNQNGTFIASQVLAKHDEKYMPPQVAALLKPAKP
jgi:cytochrome c-type biogenesis protein CcmE